MNQDPYIIGILNYRTRLIGYFRLILRQHDLAEEAFQETFIKLMELRDRYDTSCPLWAWMRGVGANVARSVERRHSRPTLSNDLLDSIQSALDEPDPSLDMLESRLAILPLCIKKLRQDHQKVLSWRYAQGLSMDDISKQTGRSPGAVQVTISRIRALLRQCIETVEQAQA